MECPFFSVTTCNGCSFAQDPVDAPDDAMYMHDEDTGETYACTHPQL